MLGKQRQKLNWEKYFYTRIAVESVLIFLSILAGIFCFYSIFYGNFFGQFSNQYVSQKMLFWLLQCFIFGGQVTLIVFSNTYFNDKMGSKLVISFYKNPQNKYTYVRLKIPDNYQYQLSDLKGFFRQMHYHQQFSNYTMEKKLNYGFGSYQMCFDIVIEKNKVEVFLALSTKYINYLDISLQQFLPDIKYEIISDPFENFEKKWNDEIGSDNYKCLAGSALGYQLSHLFSSAQIIDQKTTSAINLPTNSLIKNIKDNLDTQKVILQFVFGVENANRMSLYKNELKDLQQKMYERFTLRNTKPQNETEVIKVTLPEEEKNRLKIMDKRMHSNQSFVSANIKIIALCSKKEYIKTENILEQALRSSSRKTRSDQNEIEKMYQTATNQRYYNLGSKTSPVAIPYLYSTYYFPPQWLEPFLSNIYDNVFYYNENKYRRQTIYNRFIRRSGQGPWYNKNTLLDFDSLVSVFQIPTVK